MRESLGATRDPVRVKLRGGDDPVAIGVGGAEAFLHHCGQLARLEEPVVVCVEVVQQALVHAGGRLRGSVIVGHSGDRDRPRRCGRGEDGERDEEGASSQGADR